MRAILIALILLIAYGSLYPWRFEPQTLPASPVWILLHSWNSGTDRYALFDVIVNIALYIPLGMSASLGFQTCRIPYLRIWAPVLLAALLSASIEMAQIFEPTRHCSAIDLVANIVGSILGVIAALVLAGITGPRTNAKRGVPVDQVALALLGCWVVWLLFPLCPVLGRTALRQKFGVFLHAPLLAPIPLISMAAVWFAAGKLLASLKTSRAKRLLALLLLLIPAQFLIVTRQPTPAQFIGAVAGTAAFWFCGTRSAGPIFLLVLIVRGLVPFHLSAQAQSFSWIPFGGFLEMDWQPGIQLLLEKVLYYGTAIWLLRVEGMHLWKATGLIVLLLAAIEAVQIHIPGRTPEMTDPILALLFGCGASAFAFRSSPQPRQVPNNQTGLPSTHL